MQKGGLKVALPKKSDIAEHWKKWLTENHFVLGNQVAGRVKSGGIQSMICLDYRANP